MVKRWNTIVIAGGGPAGCTVATLLARAGKKVVVFAGGKRPALVVGESLIPAVIPVLRRLGIEEEVKAYSTYKPGATFRIDERECHFDFDDFGGRLPHYAYNVPREKFDDTLLGAARAAGVEVINDNAHFNVSEDGKGLVLTQECREKIKSLDSIEPDLLIDASGRKRVFAKRMNVPSHEGNRKDTVLFAHIDNASTTNDGYIHIGQLTHGWHWFIPLPDRMSLGFVVNGEKLKSYGTTNEERYDYFSSTEPEVTAYAPNVKRLTEVMAYTNYQMVSSQCVGDGWAMVGDAAGFIDPIFSSGLFLSMDGAVRLADTILQGGMNSMQRYQTYVLNHIEAWHRIVNYYYSGHMLALFQINVERKPNFFSAPFRRHAHKQMGRILTGQAATETYTRRFVDFLAKFGPNEKDIQRHKIE